MKTIKIFETYKSNKLVVNEDKDGLVHMTGLFGETGVKNRNGRIYDKQNYSAMVEALQPEIERGLLGELDHPRSLSINLENVSHKIDSLEMNEDGTCTGEISLLNTPSGKIAKSLVEAGLPIYVSSRGIGTMNENGEVKLSRIITWDIVSTPSVEKARFDIKENEQLETIDEDCFIIIENNDEQSESKDKVSFCINLPETKESETTETEVTEPEVTAEPEKVDETEKVDVEEQIPEKVDLTSIKDEISKW